MNAGRARMIFDAFATKVLRSSGIRHLQSSLIYSKEDATASTFLISTCADAIKLAWTTELQSGNEGLDDHQFLNVFPGEHYRLLNALMHAIDARVIVEIGTFTGLGTLALREGLPSDTRVTTFDIIEWDKVSSPSHLASSDFDSGRIRQVIGDLSQDEVFSQNYTVLDEADVIFLDAPKDDVFEYKMAEKLQRLSKKERKLLIIDDIQFVNMIDFWRSIQSPKIDVTSFGHWSGTGIVDISDGFRIAK